MCMDELMVHPQGVWVSGIVHPQGVWVSGVVHPQGVWVSCPSPGCISEWSLYCIMCMCLQCLFTQSQLLRK